MATRKISNYLKQFSAIYEGKPWYGRPMKQICDGISGTIAFKQPTKNAHSIAQLLAHIIYWRMPLIKNLEGDHNYVPSMESEENWKSLNKLKRFGWKNILKEFYQSQDRLIAVLSSQNDSLLKSKYSEKYTYQQLIDGILQHDLYHIGQIAYLKSIYLKKK